MKIKQSLLLFLPLFLFGLVGCNHQDPVQETTPEAQLQQSMAGDPNLCIECQQGCILGYDYSPINANGQNSGGGYMVTVFTGTCTCHQDNGGTWYVVGGNITSSSQVGGQPGTNMLVINSVMTLWQFNCYSSGGGNGDPHTWVTWLDEINELQPVTPINVTEWPGNWGITVQPAVAPGHITVDLVGESQASELGRLRILPTGGSSSLLDIQANGANTYDLDLTGLANGDYTISLEFAPGFVLQTTMSKY